MSDLRSETNSQDDTKGWQYRILPRILLIVAALAVIGLLLSVGLLAMAGSVPIYGLPATADKLTVEAVFVFLGLFLALALLITFPLQMVITYRTAAIKWIRPKIKEDLFLAGIEQGRELDDRMSDFDDRNSQVALVWPTVGLTVFLLLMWGVTIAPNGLNGLSDALTLGDRIAPGIYTVNGKKLFGYMVEHATLLTWIFLGAYFYILTVFIRRWRQADITSGLIWGANIRLAVVVVLGLLLMGAWPDVPIFIAFVAGIAPDRVLAWLWDRVKDGVALFKKEDAEGIFKRRDLEKDIQMSFWQAERLSEAGIDSVQDLATQELPSLLIQTRFKTPTLLYWIDQALLINQVGSDDIKMFRDAYIKTASDLFDIKGGGERKELKKIETSIAEASPEKSRKITLSMLENLVQALENGPNLGFIKAYWINAHRPEMLTKKRAELRA